LPTPLRNIHARFLLALRLVHNAFLNIRCEAKESFLNVNIGLRRDLEERDAKFVCECLSTLGADHALVFPVALVADEDFVDARGGVLFDVGEPCADVWVLCQRV
jgi:hypothetical protein